MRTMSAMERKTQSIPLRRIRFSFDAASVPRDWYGGDPVLTAFWNAFSLLLPEGERFFVDSVRAYRSEIEDEVLAAQVNGFIGQEAMHSKGHNELNALVKAHGYASAPKIESELHTLLELVRKVVPMKLKLAVTCALEHFTALMGEQLLAEPEHQAQIDERVRDLWIWHALEESEHKSVAYDLYEAKGGGYFVRALVMVVTTVILGIVLVGAHLRLLADHGNLFAFRSWAHTLNWLWGKPGLFRKLIVPYLAYYRPRFHPADHDSRGLLAAWTEKLFGAEGSLRERASIVAPSQGVAA